MDGPLFNSNRSGMDGGGKKEDPYPIFPRQRWVLGQVLLEHVVDSLFSGQYR